MKGSLQKILDGSLKNLEESLGCDVISYTGPIDQKIKKGFKAFIEDLKSDSDSDRICVILTTGGGQVEGTEDMVNILRRNYDQVDFIVPDMAMSAGTILCMSGDNIYMTYDATLGPIDPQIPGNDGKYIPASGYLDRINELIKKEEEGGVLTTSELNIVVGSDIGKLKFIEQAKELTVTLLKEWLVMYKFKNWNTHSGQSGQFEEGAEVTENEKEARAEEIAKKLGDVDLWHTHGRSIDLNKLRDRLLLKIEDINDYEWKGELEKYYDILSSIVTPSSFFLHSRKHI